MCLGFLTSISLYKHFKKCLFIYLILRVIICHLHMYVNIYILLSVKRLRDMIFAFCVREKEDNAREKEMR